jgi:hypothetical protein
MKLQLKQLQFQLLDLCLILASQPRLSQQAGDQLKKMKMKLEDYSLDLMEDVKNRSHEDAKNRKTIKLCFCNLIYHGKQGVTDKDEDEAGRLSSSVFAISSWM